MTKNFKRKPHGKHGEYVSKGLRTPILSLRCGDFDYGRGGVTIKYVATFCRHRHRRRSQQAFYSTPLSIIQLLTESSNRSFLHNDTNTFPFQPAPGLPGLQPFRSSFPVPLNHNNCADNPNSPTRINATSPPPQAVPPVLLPPPPHLLQQPPTASSKSLLATPGVIHLLHHRLLLAQGQKI